MLADRHSSLQCRKLVNAISTATLFAVSRASDCRHLLHHTSYLIFFALYQAYSRRWVLLFEHHFGRGHVASGMIFIVYDARCQRFFCLTILGAVLNGYCVSSEQPPCNLLWRSHVLSVPAHNVKILHKKLEEEKWWSPLQTNSFILFVFDELMRWI